MTFFHPGQSRSERQYVFDLGDVIGTLQSMVFPQEQRYLAKAFIVEHLHEFHFMDTHELPGLPLRHRDAVRRMSQRGGAFVRVLNQRLWRTFYPMTFDVAYAWRVDASFKHNVLTVKVYHH